MRAERPPGPGPANGRIATGLCVRERERFLILLFDMQTGASGDMILGALFDLGLDFAEWKARMQSLRLDGLAYALTRAPKHGIMASHFRVQAPHEHAHRGLSEIRGILERSGLPEKAKRDAVAVFTRLAEAEAGIHGVPVERVHFHEVGALDAIADIAGACLGFDMLGIETFYATPFTFGVGSVESAHGRLAEPVPATLALTQGFLSRRTDLPGELCTPTGAAIITAFAQPLPAGFSGSIRKIGYGAGTRDLPGTANVLRLCLMDEDMSESSASVARAVTAASAVHAGIGGLPEGYDLYQVECNLDNMTPEHVAYAAERLLDAGCKDVWQESILMKKNRVAVKLCALVDDALLDQALGLIAAETATGGMRYFPVKRLIAEKSSLAVETRYGRVDVKCVTFSGTIGTKEIGTKYAPEFESCRALAQKTGVPLQIIYREALALAALREGP